MSESDTFWQNNQWRTDGDQFQTGYIISKSVKYYLFTLVIIYLLFLKIILFYFFG